MTSNKVQGPTESNKRKGYRLWVITCLCIVIALVAGYLNYNYLYMVYMYNFKLTSYKPGDKVYVSQQYYDNGNLDALAALRLIRPLTMTDIAKMNVSSEKKEHLKSIIDPSLKTYAKITIGYFSLDSVTKSKSGYIGNYLDKKILDVQYTDKSRKILLPDVVYVIKPNEMVFSRDESYYYQVIPENYTLADSNIYVTPAQVSPKELTHFRNN